MFFNDYNGEVVHRYLISKYMAVGYVTQNTKMTNFMTN